MNKTVIISVAIVTAGIVALGCFFINSTEKIKKITITLTETRDRFTVCVDTVMVRSNEANKPITAGEAKDICLQAERF